MVTAIDRSTVTPQTLSHRAVFYLLGNEGILFSEINGKVYRLNASAAYIWCCCEAGFAPITIARMLTKRFDISRQIARRDVIQAFVEWRDAGLLGGDALLEQPESHPAPIDEPLDSPIRSPARSSISSTPYEHFYQLLDVCLQIRYPCQAAMAWVHPIFSHLEIHSAAHLNSAHTIIDIIQDGENFSVFRDGVPNNSVGQLSELAPLFQREALLAAYEHTECLAAIHSAAVCNDKGQCILLSASSGGGKSTFTAALLSSGFTYLTDELCLLETDAHAIRPAYVSLALKRDSWSILAIKYPQLRVLPTHLQEGVTEVKYLTPPESKPPKKSYRVSYLIFPKYRANAPPKLTKLAPAEALYCIAQAGYDLPGRLNKQSLEVLIGWIAQLESYELQLSEIDEAVGKIKELLA